MVTFVLDIASFFLEMYYRFRDIAHNSAYLPVVGALLESFFNSISLACWNIYYYLDKFAYRLNDWVSYITEKLYYLDDLAYYVYQQITILLNNALNYARTAYDRVVEITAYLEDIPQLIIEFIEGYLGNVWDRLRQIPQEIKDTITGYFEDFWKRIAQYVNDVNEQTLSTLARPINLVNTWFDDIQNFFNDPLGSILDWLSETSRKHETQLLNVIDRVLDALWG